MRKIKHKLEIISNEELNNNIDGYVFIWTLAYYIGELKRLYNVSYKKLNDYNEIDKLDHEVYNDVFYPQSKSLLKSYIKLLENIIVDDSWKKYTNNKGLIKLIKNNITSRKGLLKGALKEDIKDIKDKTLIKYIDEMIYIIAIFSIMDKAVNGEQSHLLHLINKKDITQARTITTKTRKFYNQILIEFKG